jgi:enamine deaminase RidA (YjgF/YER057c/UK114 family)
MDIYKKLKHHNLEILPATPKGGIYTPVRLFGEKFLYLSGVGSLNRKDPDILGKVGCEVSLEEGQEAARRSMMNILSNLHHYLGDLNRIKSFVKLLVFVASDSDFHQQPQVANGASELLRDIFGEEIGLPARSAIGTNVLPNNIPVEIEVLLELK